MDIVFSIIILIALALSIIYLIRKRKERGVTGFKTALTSICFYLIAVVNLCTYWFNFLGIISWSLTIGLLILGAYFTKFLPK